jgi:predicted O-methyltransferase YrrM
MILDDINKEYDLNREYYDKIANSIKSNIDGRICHHGVVVLNIITNLLDIKKYVEIGVHNGTSMSYVVSNDRRMECYGIDLFESTIKQYHNDNLTYNRTLSNIEKNNKGESLIKLIKGNSFNNETIDNLLSYTGEESIDLLFIDGDHSFKGVSLDFNNYEKFVKPGGIIIIDDYSSRWPDIVKFCDNNIDKSIFTKIGVFSNNEMIIIKNERN